MSHKVTENPDSSTYRMLLAEYYSIVFLVHNSRVISTAFPILLFSFILSWNKGREMERGDSCYLLLGRSFAWIFYRCEQKIWILNDKVTTEKGFRDGIVWEFVE